MLHDDKPRYMDYAMFGSTLGHESFHNFDYNTLTNVTKWGSDTVEVYSEKAKCIRQQYEDYLRPLLSSDDDTLKVLYLLSNASKNRVHPYLFTLCKYNYGSLCTKRLIY